MADGLRSSLDPDVLSLIVSHLDIISLSHLSCTSRFWRQFVDQDQVWQTHSQRLGFTELPVGVTTWKGACRVGCCLMVGDIVEARTMTRNEWGLFRVLAVKRPSLYLLTSCNDTISAMGFGTEGEELIELNLTEGNHFWVHVEQDRHRVRAPTAATLLAFTGHDMSEMVFSLAAALAEQLVEAGHAWTLPAARLGFTFPAPYHRSGPRQSDAVPFVLELSTGIEAWRAQQVRRGLGYISVQRLRASVTSGHSPVSTVPTFPEPVGVWPVAALGCSSQYAQTRWDCGQAVGPPVAFPRYGDLAGTWAPRPPQSPLEHLDLELPRKLRIGCVHIFENFHPGAVCGLSVWDDATNRWTAVWRGQPDPQNSQVSQIMRIFTYQPSVIASDRLRIELNTSQNRGWSEIDAVRVYDVTELDQEPAALTHFISTLTLGNLAAPIQGVIQTKPQSEPLDEEEGEGEALRPSLLSAVARMTIGETADVDEAGKE